MFRPIGPAVVLIGDPTVALGAGMVHLGDTEDVGFNAGLRGAFTSSARLAGTPQADGLYQHAPAPEAQVQLTDASIANLKALIMNAVETAAVAPVTVPTLGGGDEFEQIDLADVPTLCILPVTQIADGVDAPNAIWMPAVSIAGLDGFQWGRVPEGEILQPYNVRFTAARRTTDQADDPIPAGNRIWFMGPPANLELTWSLPANL